jgi:hypothetical protein
MGIRQAFQVRGPLQALRLAWKLRPTGPCLMCHLGFERVSGAAARPQLIQEGRDRSYLSSVWGYHGTVTAEDRAALISAVD